MSTIIGFIGIIIAAVGFGTNFLIIKKWSPGDGMFFQLNMTIAIWITGTIFHIGMRDSPPFQPFAMIGGALWATGNALCPFIIEHIGMGLGLLIWGTANMSIGWASSHFGILLVAKQSVSKPTINVIGFIIAVASVMVYSQIKPMGAEEKAERKKKKNASKYANSVNYEYEYESGSLDKMISDGTDSGASADAATAKSKNLRYIVPLAAVAAGVLFGSCFNPPVYVVDQSNQKFCSHISDETFCNDINRYCETDFNVEKNGSKLINCTDLASYKGRMYCNYDTKKKTCGPIPLEDMVFSQFTGILMTSFFWCVAYILYKQWWLGGEPWVNKPLIGPGFACGAVWAFAQIGWFFANANLPLSVSFPITTTAPGLIGTIIGIVFFDEVSLKTKNLSMLVFAIVMAGVADGLITYSM
eukprot:m.145294 g.145294  ORF g.145294 m.145294 type:complete len:414 (+) comp17731_c0_seq1:47-1288(+)